MKENIWEGKKYFSGILVLLIGLFMVEIRQSVTNAKWIRPSERGLDNYLIVPGWLLRKNGLRRNWKKLKTLRNAGWKEENACFIYEKVLKIF